MGKEIERKFLVKKSKWSRFKKPKGEYYNQGYLTTDPNMTIRIRVAEKQAYITIKGKGEVMMSHPEFEFPISKKDGEEILNLFARSKLEKVRYLLKHDDHIWSVDEFMGDNEGLILAEVELKVESEDFSIPDWIDREVTDDYQYYNSYLAANPFNKWENLKYLE